MLDYGVGGMVRVIRGAVRRIVVSHIARVRVADRRVVGWDDWTGSARQAEGVWGIERGRVDNRELGGRVEM